MVFGELTLNNEKYHFQFDNYELYIHRFNTEISEYKDMEDILSFHSMEMPQTLIGMCYPDDHYIYFMQINHYGTTNNVKKFTVKSYFEIKNSYDFPQPISQIAIMSAVDEIDTYEDATKLIFYVQQQELIRLDTEISLVDLYYDDTSMLINDSASTYKEHSLLSYDGERLLIDEVNQSLMQEQLWDVLDTLTPREEKVLRLRFGLDDGKQRTLEEVGKAFKLTRERIRQIEAKALRKLRHPSRSKKLRDFVEPITKQNNTQEKKKTVDSMDGILAHCVPEGVSLTGIQQKYMLAIIELFEQKKVISVGDVAQHLNKSIATTTSAMKRLEAKRILTIDSKGIIALHCGNYMLGKTTLKELDSDNYVNSNLEPHGQESLHTKSVLGIQTDKECFSQFLYIEDFLLYVKDLGIVTKDNRIKDGCLWIKADPLIDDIVKKLQFEGRGFRFAASSKALNGESGWYY